MLDKSRDKAILIGLFLSKFDKQGLNALGFSSFQEAFNTLGFTVSVKPASIKNYRDEFDPYFSNDRKGWHKRNIRDYCKKIYDEYSNLDFDIFVELIKSLLIDNYDIEKIVKKVKEKDYTRSVAKRLATGKAAEEYFKMNYRYINEFENYSIKDTRNLACGFDYKLSIEENLFYCVEVKGLYKTNGSIQMTEKEFQIAKKLKKSYCLFIVVNFIDKPFHKMVFNPLHSEYNFKKIEQNVKQITYRASI